MSLPEWQAKGAGTERVPPLAPCRARRSSPSLERRFPSNSQSMSLSSHAQYLRCEVHENAVSLLASGRPSSVAALGLQSMSNAVQRLCALCPRLRFEELVRKTLNLGCCENQEDDCSEWNAMCTQNRHYNQKLTHCLPAGDIS